MQERDIPAALELMLDAFEALDRRLGEPPAPRPDPAVAAVRFRDLVRRDPEGAWLAEDERGLAGAALALLREGVWGLSLLVVRPDAQSGGIGRALLAAAHDYAAGARGRIIMASPDERAIRAYARLGLELHPTFQAAGRPRGLVPPAGLRVGDADDLPLTEAVDRAARGAARGADIATLLEMGQTLLILPDRGYAVVGDGRLRTLAAFDDASAQELLRGALAGFDVETTVSPFTTAQQWAVPVLLEAGLRLRGQRGAMLLGGDVGPFSPYVPTGAFL